MSNFKLPKRFVFLATLVLSYAAAGRAAIITGARIVHEGRDISRGTLFVTANGRERAVAKGAWRSWIVAGGRALLWAGSDGAGGYENEGQSLWRYDAASGRRRKLMAEAFMISNVREARARSGRTALLVSMRDGGLGAPHVAVVHPRRGQVWRRTVARVAAIRNGRLAVAVLRPQDITDSRPSFIRRLRPARMLYLDLDLLLRRPALKSLTK